MRTAAKESAITSDALTPSKEQIEALRDRKDPGPAVQLNLLKYKEPNGRERFSDYVALVSPILARQGGEFCYIGEAGPTLAGETWDTCVMIRFPDIESLIGLGTDPEYLAKAPALRAAALERTLLMVTQPPSA